jgi:hypothetical protein
MKTQADNAPNLDELHSYFVQEAKQLSAIILDNDDIDFIENILKTLIPNMELNYLEHGHMDEFYTDEDLKKLKSALRIQKRIVDLKKALVNK